MVLAMPPLFPCLPPWSSWSALSSWLTRPMELRIDVSHKPAEDEFESLYDRLYSPGDRLHGIPAMELNGQPELMIRFREADGEFYVYVEDIRRKRLAGYTVFNRLIEVNRRADRYIRAPHSRYDEAYQRRGLASSIYQWGLGAGLCLVSGARQSPGAHALWHALARRHELGYVDLRNKTLTYLGRDVPARTLDDLHTRMILLGEAWTVDRFAAATGMR